MAKQNVNPIKANVPVVQKPFLKQRIPIGSHLYLFKDSNGVTHQLTNECLISARASAVDPILSHSLRDPHSRYLSRIGDDYEILPMTFKVPGNSCIRFYNTPGSEPDDGASVRRFHENNQYSGDRLINYGGGSMCPNLMLSKYQVSLPNTNMAYVPHDLTAKSYPIESYDLYDQFPYDIVTVRHRLLLGNTTLHNLIREMEQAHRHYNVYHCLLSSD
jgi:hypothetical protein